jgi:hypothetical protein
MLGQHQPLPGRGQLPPAPPAPPAPGQGHDLVGGSLVVGAGLPAGLLGLGGAVVGQLQLPGAVRRTLCAEVGEAVAFGPQRPCGQPPHIRQVRGVVGKGLAAIPGQHLGQQLLGRPRLPM